MKILDDAATGFFAKTRNQSVNETRACASEHGQPKPRSLDEVLTVGLPYRIRVFQKIFLNHGGIPSLPHYNTGDFRESFSLLGRPDPLTQQGYSPLATPRKSLELDNFDRKILTLLQKDASLSLADLSEAVGLSQTPCWKRVRRLETEGFIRGRVALVDRDRLGLGVTVFVQVRTSQHDAAWLSQFAQAVAALPEVVEFYRMSGEIDYLLKVVCADIADYDRVYKRLIAAAKLHDVSSSFAMEQIKYTTEIPV
jgi:Lrp/AsnC family transcriptional regulator